MQKENITSLIDDILSISKELHPDLHQKVLTLKKLRAKELLEHHRIIMERDKQNTVLIKKGDELNALKEQLEERVAKEIEMRLEKEKILERQSKMAAMGEMMDAVAHQWKQPLNALSMYADLLKMDFKEGEVDQAYIDGLVDNMQEQIKHMVTTIGEFRTFFRHDKESEPFGLKRCIQSVLLLIHDELLRNNIEVHVESKKEIIINGVENEFKHLVLNIISNAKDAFVERERSQRDIYIKFAKKGSWITVEIEDNAGGIPPEIIDDIFKPNVTTKSEEKGTGIGLYMSAQIAQKMQGTLSVTNTDRGAMFRLKIRG